MGRDGNQTNQSVSSEGVKSCLLVLLEAPIREKKFLKISSYRFICVFWSNLRHKSVNS